MLVRQLCVVVSLTVFLCAESAFAQEIQSEVNGNVTCAEIDQLLDQKCDMVFEDATLDQFVAFLEISGIRTHINVRALEDYGIGTDTPMTFRQHAIRMRDGIKFALESIDLVAAPRNGRLVITTADALEERLITKVYDVRNLVELVPRSGFLGGQPQRIVYQYDFNPLIDAIYSAIEPDSWDEVGGPASIRPFYTRRMRAIVVAQSYDHHRQIQVFLKELTTLGGTKPLSSISNDSTLMHRYRLQMRSPVRQPSRRGVEIRSSQLRTTGR